MKLSIIVPVYNAERYIGKLIESVVAQDYQDFELIIVDDGSIDKSPEIIKQYAEKDERIRLYEKLKNEGVSAARNTGMKMATGEYIAFLDADDRIDSCIYKRLIEALEKYKSDIAMCRIAYEDELTGKILEENWIDEISEGILSDSNYQLFVNSLINIDNHIFAGIIRFVYKREVLNTHFFDTNLFYQEDLIFLIQLFSTRIKISYVEFVGYYYLRNLSSTVEKYNDKMLENMSYILQKIKETIDKSEILKDSKKLLNMKVFEMVSFSISNLYRKNAPKRTRIEYKKEIKHILKELSRIEDISDMDCNIIYRFLLILAKLKMYGMIHFIYSKKEKIRQKKMS